MTEQIKNEIRTLVESARIAQVSSIDADGYPNNKAMLTLHHDDLFTHYFSTNYFSRRVRQFQANPRASVYFCDEGQFKGLLLVGQVEVLADHESKAKFWRPGFEIYYPDGIDTENYCIYKFTAHRANYYHNLQNTDFTLEEYENA